MTVRASDLQWRRISGRALGSDVIPSNTLHALFGPLSGAGQRDGATETVAIAFVNTSTTSSLSGLKVFLSQVDAAGATVDIALDAMGVQPMTGQLASSPTAYSAPTSEAAGLSVATLGPSQALVLWVRRRGANTTGATPERNTLTVTATT